MASLGESRANYRAKTVATLCSKGGVGKSTLTAQILDNAARFGLRVAGVDLDPNGSLSRMTGTLAPVGEISIREVLEGSITPQAATRKPLQWQPEVVADRAWAKGGPLIPGGEVHIVPAPDRGLDAVTSRSGTEAEHALFEAITTSGFGEYYDMIIVDPPASTASTFHLALNAAQHLVFPLQTESAALSGLVLTIESAIKFSSSTGRPVNGIGVAATMMDGRTTEHTETLAAAKEWMQEKFHGQLPVLEPPVPRRTTVPEAGAEMLPVARVARGSKGAQLTAAYSAIALAVVASVVPEKTDAIFDAFEAADLPAELAEVVFANFRASEDPSASLETPAN
ncbi:MULTISPECIES: ParA family protein [Rhodococcus]|uniref:ParA family protein n=1 Tax=Rhodococcus TaxID=1827 RepID=UPI0007D9A929|nr:MULTISPECIES: ParA family protein [Rhodococcus]MCF8786160.1 ParA family protein [Rhodococcus ruber]UTM40262.1 ParA family protein [Rhodococcus pyridinivorans]WAL49709.1 ParA family protein [Rhodococcus pyridinivorans]